MCQNTLLKTEVQILRQNRGGMTIDEGRSEIDQKDVDVQVMAELSRSDGQGRPEPARSLEGHHGDVTSAVFANDRQRLASRPSSDQLSFLYSKPYNYTLSNDEMWILQDGRRKLWLPPLYRPERFAVAQTGVGWEGGFDSLALEKPAGKVHRVPGHCQVPGNEAVDQLAKVGCMSEGLLGSRVTVSLTAARRQKNEALKADFRHWIKENCPKIRHLGGALNRPKPFDIGWMKGLHRGAATRILAARSGHGHFEEYHVWLNHLNAEIRCPVAGCGQSKTFSYP
ncbi:putative double-stranded RNA/RNA-DNA hybrid binding protein [Ceratocystis lukuohia]|uniref:Double-stranded RNA/RNA-DNA hybrid binding protein n=1 Tax=Ceratocystis lukuohia TaxID=2019550 RepID=A0ABR4M8N0_9PEZI